MSDRTLIILAAVFVIVIFVVVINFQTPIAQVLDTFVRNVRLTD